MPVAICLECGSAKNAPWKTCEDCGLNPNNDPDALVRSVYLSVGRFDSSDDRKAYEDELAVFAACLRRGEEVTFDANEVARLREQRAEVESVSTSDLIGTLFRFFLPGSLFLLALVAVLIILKCQ